MNAHPDPSFLRGVSLLGDLDDDELRAVSSLFRRVERAPTQPLFVQGSESRAVYVVERGLLAISSRLFEEQPGPTTRFDYACAATISGSANLYTARRRV